MHFNFNKSITLTCFTTTTFYVKALTPFNDPVYRTISITEDVHGINCMQQTLTPNILFPYEFRGIKNYAADDPVTALDLTQGFTNSDPTNCPVEYKLLTENQRALDDPVETDHAYLSTVFAINGNNEMIAT